MNSYYYRCYDCITDLLIENNFEKVIHDHKLECLNYRISNAEKLLQKLEQQKEAWLQKDLKQQKEAWLRENQEMITNN